MNSLQRIIEKLKLSSDVDAVFLTGSHGKKEAKPYSDIDLVIILKENKHELYSLYRWVDGVFADIFFFDLEDLRKIGQNSGEFENEIYPVLFSWLKKADIQFDKSGILTALRQQTLNLEDIVEEKIKKNIWQKINYNHVANKRYFESKDPLYLEALELRLLYSTIEAVSGFLEFRGHAWRGEKEAVRRLTRDYPEFYKLFQSYCAAANLDERFKLYEQMVKTAFTDEYKMWTEGDEVVIKKTFLSLKLTIKRQVT